MSASVKDWRCWATALGALSKPLFAIAPTAGVVFSARMIDRVGKGIRGAPRDALVADVTPPEIRGAAYGLRQALDTVGAFLGPLLAVLLMFIWANDFHAIFWVAVIPGVLSILLLGFGLQEPNSAIAHKRSNPLKRENLKKALRRLLVGGRDRQHFHPRPLQRSLSGAARPADGDPALYHPAGDGGDEPGLQPHGLPVR
ncbi:major facilitator superfamily permease [Klebsiella pneumoniae subsp. ozaenae]|uniref:Major facilitator superfamily permease n=1 Tax=Klebsiella pneumoniae subsp. ozaenae TaxID=574 RepID=A0A378B1N5_KLEPO|nr:major facilitator superfamily permease [Klebsiella pneumoniae subsp. ozaenae]